MSACVRRVCVLTLLQLSSAADYDFATLYIPLLLLPEAAPDSVLTEPVYIKYVIRLLCCLLWICLAFIARLTGAPRLY